MGNSYADQTKAGEISGWHVYVIQEDGDGFSKIGSAINVDYRLQGLKGGNPRTLRLVRKWHFSDRDAARSVEARALQLADAVRLLNRDWLEAPSSQSVKYVERAIAELDARLWGGAA